METCSWTNGVADHVDHHGLALRGRPRCQRPQRSRSPLHVVEKSQPRPAAVTGNCAWARGNQRYPKRIVSAMRFTAQWLALGPPMRPLSRATVAASEVLLTARHGPAPRSTYQSLLASQQQLHERICIFGCPLMHPHRDASASTAWPASTQNAPRQLDNKVDARAAPASAPTR